MTTEIVPFGKYKGQPLEVLAADKSYTDWLVQQDWFRQRYPGVYTIIINNFAQPSETPEHNTLQAKFLDDEFCLKFAYALDERRFPAKFVMYEQIEATRKEWLEQYTSETHVDSWGNTRQLHPNAPNMGVNNQTGIGRKFEEGGIDVSLRVELGYTLFIDDAYFNLAVDDPKLGVRYLNYTQSYNILHSWFGLQHLDLVYAIEIKPSVGDDYPAILRQMNANKSSVLLLQEYTGAGASSEQLRAIFKASSKKVVFLYEVEQAEPPDWAYELLGIEKQ